VGLLDLCRITVDQSPYLSAQRSNRGTVNEATFGFGAALVEREILEAEDMDGHVFEARWIPIFFVGILFITAGILVS
jgi:hypothetical protein